MHTTLFLVRNADTDFTRDKRVAGRRDIGLSADGRAQAAELRDRLAGGKPEVVEILASPLPRAVETAEIIAAPARPSGWFVTRASPTSTPAAGRARRITTSAPPPSTSASSPIRSPSRSPAARSSATSAIASSPSVSQALADNELGANIVIVSHAGPLRVLLAHYLGMNLIHYHRLRLSPASISVLRFESEARRAAHPRHQLHRHSRTSPALRRSSQCPSASVVISSPARSPRPGVRCVFTLCGGHIAPIYDGCLREGIDIIDTRHEQAAAHAADAWARLSRGPRRRHRHRRPGRHRRGHRRGQRPAGAARRWSCSAAPPSCASPGAARSRRWSRSPLMRSITKWSATVTDRASASPS